MKVSVVTTCYNSASTIRDTIESILSQTGPFELEYIITDAGSKDTTRSIIAEYGDRIRLIDATGTNQSQGINLGLRQARGEIVTFLNADDSYEPGAIARVVSAFASDPSKLWLAGRCRIIDGAGRELHSAITSYKNSLLRHYSYWLLLINNFICQPAVFMRREVFERYGYFSEQENYVMDYEFWLRIGADSPPILVDEYLAAFRCIEGTKSNTAYPRQFRDDARVAIQAARRLGYSWTIPFKCVANALIVLIYSFLYR